MKNIRALGAALTLLVASAVCAFALVGNQPGTGFALPDGNWLNGLAGGQNYIATSGLTAHAGGGQASAFQIPSGTELVEFDTVASGGDSAVLPSAVAGTVVIVMNTTATSMNVFASAATNSLTGSTDTINALANGTALAVGATTNTIFICAKNGKWFSK